MSATTAPATVAGSSRTCLPVRACWTPRVAWSLAPSAPCPIMTSCPASHPHPHPHPCLPLSTDLWRIPPCPVCPVAATPMVTAPPCGGAGQSGPAQGHGCGDASECGLPTRHAPAPGEPKMDTYDQSKSVLDRTGCPWSNALSLEHRRPTLTNPQHAALTLIASVLTTLAEEPAGTRVAESMFYLAGGSDLARWELVRGIMVRHDWVKVSSHQVSLTDKGREKGLELQAALDSKGGA